MSEWIEIDKFGDMPEMKDRYLLMDEDGYVYEGTSAFDYYDAIYWCPMPKIPMKTMITNDECLHLLFKESDKA